MDRLPLDCVAVTNVKLVTADDWELTGHCWLPMAASHSGTVIINPATAVKAAYYHRFARFLTRHGYAVLTYDYRGIGASRHRHPRHTPDIDKFAWGAADCDAALTWAERSFPGLPIDVVAHSIGGLLVGLAAHSRVVRRFLTVGAQFAHWRDYAPGRRLAMVLRWHLAMPLLTSLLGYFPARRLGWHEDLPAGAAYEWAFRPARLEAAYRNKWQGGLDPLRHFAAMRGEILAIGLGDDPFGTPVAIDRLLAYYRGAHRTRIEIDPAAVGVGAIGHFGYFHDRCESSLWADAVRWLRDGVVPPGYPAVRQVAAGFAEGVEHGHGA